MKPITIADLGIEDSSRYALDQETLDKSLLTESSRVSKQTTIDVTVPFYRSEINLMFGTQIRHLPWADFYTPLRYNVQQRGLFTFQMIPSFGSEEKQIGYVEKIKAQTNKRKKQKKQDKEEEEEATFSWQDQREQEEVEHESSTLIQLFESLRVMDQIIVAINAKRNQYQRG